MAAMGVGRVETERDSAVPGWSVVETGVKREKRFISREAEIMGAGFIILASSFIYPHVESVLNRVMPECLFHRITGLPCLLCGMTRSLAATAHGDLMEAFRLHLLGPPLFASAAAVTTLLAAEMIASRRILPRPDRRGRKIMAWGVLGLLAAAWVTRLALFGVNI